MKNAKYRKNLDILLDSTNKSCRDSKSKKYSEGIKFQLTYGHFSRGTVSFGTPWKFYRKHSPEMRKSHSLNVAKYFDTPHVSVLSNQKEEMIETDCAQ